MPAHADVSADNTQVRVTAWSFSDGDATGHHRHEYDYVVVPITDNTFEVVNEDGSVRELNQHAGVAYVGVAGTAHDVINRSGRNAMFVEIELKR